jgi:hypothetical protein
MDVEKEFDENSPRNIYIVYVYDEAAAQEK